MNAFQYTHGRYFIESAYVASNTLKFMLLNGLYIPTKADQRVDAAASTDPSHAEITATGYTRGWGGSGRRTASISVIEDDPGGRVKWIYTTPVWSSLGGVTNDVIVAAALVKEGTSDDTTTVLLSYFPFAAASITGTVAIANGSPTVTGTGTNFTGQARAGQVLYFSGDATGTPYMVSSVSSNTVLTLQVAYAGTTASGVTVTVAGVTTSGNQFSLVMDPANGNTGVNT